MSIAPFSSRNSARWKPSGSFCRTVCSMTRGPAKPIRAFGSAITTSPSMAKLGEIGQRCGGFRHLRERQRALLHARAARGGDAHERQLLLDRDPDAAHKAL